MKNQASVLLQVVDSPINTTIPTGYLSIRAKSTGLVVVDSTGTETVIGSGGGGADGITPHIDATTNHWMIGETDTEVNASGALWQIPRTFYSYNDATYGTCNRLDATVDVLKLADRFDSLSGLKLEVQSASNTISGNISLTVTLADGATTESKAVVIAVGTAAAWQVIDLTGMTLRNGKLTITRDYSATADTLKDGATVVTAVVMAVRYKELD